MLSGKVENSMSSGVIVSWVLADFVGSATLAAVINTALRLGTAAGAVYVAMLAPVVAIGPTMTFPF